MKMTKGHFSILGKEINKIINTDLIDKYETGQFHRSGDVNDLNKRFRWDLYWLIPTSERRKIEFDEEKWEYNDYTSDHIDTALRKIVPKITRRY